MRCVNDTLAPHAGHSRGASEQGALGGRCCGTDSDTDRPRLGGISAFGNHRSSGRAKVTLRGNVATLGTTLALHIVGEKRLCPRLKQEE